MESRSCLYLNVYAPCEVGIVWKADRASMSSNSPHCVGIYTKNTITLIL